MLMVIVGFYPQGIDTAMGSTLNVAENVSFFALHSRSIGLRAKFYACPSRGVHNVSEASYKVDKTGDSQNEVNQSYLYFPSFQAAAGSPLLHRSRYNSDRGFIRERMLNHQYEFGNILFGSSRVEGFKSPSPDTSSITRIIESSWVRIAVNIYNNMWFDSPVGNNQNYTNENPRAQLFFD